MDEREAMLPQPIQREVESSEAGLLTGWQARDAANAVAFELPR